MRNAWHAAEEHMLLLSLYILFSSFHTHAHIHTPLVHNIVIIYDFQLQVWVSIFQDGIQEL